MGSIILLIRIGQPACSTLFSSAVSDNFCLRINYEGTSLVRRTEGLSSAVYLFEPSTLPLNSHLSILNSHFSILNSQFGLDVEDMVEAAEAEDVFNVFVEVAYGDGAAAEFAVLLELHEEAET